MFNFHHCYHLMCHFSDWPVMANTVCSPTPALHVHTFLLICLYISINIFLIIDHINSSTIFEIIYVRQIISVSAEYDPVNLNSKSSVCNFKFGMLFNGNEHTCKGATLSKCSTSLIVF